MLVGNLLLASGGEPSFYDRRNMPAYPLPLPHHIPETIVNLTRCSTEVIRSLFMVIERPAETGAPAEADQYETLGQFYAAIEAAVKVLTRSTIPSSIDSFLNPPSTTRVKFDSAGSGGLVGVSDCDSAIEAMETIIHQGEGGR